MENPKKIKAISDFKEVLESVIKGKIDMSLYSDERSKIKIAKAKELLKDESKLLEFLKKELKATW